MTTRLGNKNSYRFCYDSVSYCKKNLNIIILSFDWQLKAQVRQNKVVPRKMGRMSFYESNIRDV